jgi:hypothetical protein
MAKNDFEKVKGQLKELSELLNSFNSEAVQLKLVDLMFRESGSINKLAKAAKDPKQADNTESELVKIPKKRGRKPKINNEVIDNEIVVKEGQIDEILVSDTLDSVQPEKKGKVGRPAKTDKGVKKAKVQGGKKVRGRRSKSDNPGPSKVLDDLVNEGFFAVSRSIGDVTSYCKNVKNLVVKTTDISGILMRMVKRNRLSREINVERNQYEYFDYKG